MTQTPEEILKKNTSLFELFPNASKEDREMGYHIIYSAMREFADQKPHSPNRIYDTIGELVDEAMISLKNEMELYESPTLKTAGGRPKRGIAALAEDIGVDRTNIGSIFSDRNNQQMSTWLFIRICQQLNVWPAGWEYRPTKEQERQSVKVAMMTPRDPMMVCLAYFIGR